MSIITTPRLVLRPWREIDYMDMYDYAKSPLVGPNAGWFPHRSPEESRQAVRNILRNSRCDTWAITLKETEKPIGSIGLNRRSPCPGASASTSGRSAMCSIQNIGDRALCPRPFML